MSTITTDQNLAPLINVFTVTCENQQPLVELLSAATEHVMRHRSGFVSATIHASLDGTRVVNYAQRRSREDFQAMLDDPTAQEHMNATKALATAEPLLYQVALTPAGNTEADRTGTNLHRARRHRPCPKGILADRPTDTDFRLDESAHRSTCGTFPY